MNSGAPSNPPDGGPLRHQSCNCSLLVLVTLGLSLDRVSWIALLCPSPPKGVALSVSTVVLHLLANARQNSSVDSSFVTVPLCFDQTKPVNLVQHLLTNRHVLSSNCAVPSKFTQAKFTESVASMTAAFLSFLFDTVFTTSGSCQSATRGSSQGGLSAFAERALKKNLLKAHTNRRRNLHQGDDYNCKMPAHT